MDSPTNFDSLLNKLEEVRAVFVLSRRSMPFLEEFFGFVQDVAPLIEEIDKAIRQSSGEMPQAKSQLESVSQATELATTEILDLVDAVLADLCGIEQRIERAAAQAAALEAADERLMALLRDALGPDEAALLSDAEAIYEEKQALRAEHAAADDVDESDALAAVRQKMNRIMLSLQVQDITSQQIAGVNHLIESVRTRLTDLTRRFTAGGAPPVAARPAASEPLTFDADARYDHAPDRQQMADDLIASFGSGATGSGATDSDEPGSDLPESDAFAGDGHASDEAPDAPAGAPADDAAGAPVSQDDIDALFQ